MGKRTVLIRVIALVLCALMVLSAVTAAIVALV